MMRAGWLRLLHINSPSMLGCADQAVVSLTSFAVLVIIGRWTGPGELGAYAIGLSILALLLATQEAIITRPYSIHLLRPLGMPAEHAFNSLALSVLLCLAAAFAAGAIALLLVRLNAYRE